MDELVKLVSEKTGLSEEMAKMAVDTVIGFLKQKLPAPVASQIDGRYAIVLGHFLVGATGQRCAAPLNCLDHPWICEVGDYYVGARVVTPNVVNDALQAADALAACMPRVLVVIDCKLDEEQVYRTVA